MPGSYNKGSRPTVDRRKQQFRKRLVNAKRQLESHTVPLLAARARLMKKFVTTVEAGGVMSKSVKTQLTRKQKRVLRRRFAGETTADAMAIDRPAGAAAAAIEAGPVTVTVEGRTTGAMFTFTIGLGVGGGPTILGA